MISLGRNISALKAQRQLNTSTGGLEKIFERLASGQRINSASDDAAGLAISDSLRANSRVFSRGLKNINDGISSLSIMESAVQALQNILIRQTELAEQAATGTYSAQQRKPLDAEARELTREYNRIVESTNFNSVKLLENPYSELNIQAGYGTDGVLTSKAAGEFGRVAGTGTTKDSLGLVIGGGNSHNILAIDLNNDGYLDIVANNSRAEILLNNGDGTFAFSTVVHNLFGAGTSGDFNNDGIVDLVFQSVSSPVASIALGNGDGTFKAPLSFVSAGSSGNTIVSGDYNGDGILDIASSAYSSGTAYISFGNGDGTFKAQQTVASIGAVMSLTSGDFDGDGKDELLALGAGGIYMLSVQSSGGVTSKNVFSAPGAWSRQGLAVGDFNGDGITDFAGMVHMGGGSLRLALGLGDGKGSFSTSSVAGPADTYFNGLAKGDLNGDGIDDIIVSTYTSSILTYIADGKGSVRSAQVSTVGTQTGSVAAGDFDNDGIAEIVVGNLYADPKLALWKQNTELVSTGQFLNLTTAEGAKEALDTLARARERLGRSLGAIGAVQSRMTVAYNTLEVQSEQSLAASARIRDADIAGESANLVRIQILQQAASSVLAQANQAPALALRLLSNT